MSEEDQLSDSASRDDRETVSYSQNLGKNSFAGDPSKLEESSSEHVTHIGRYRIVRQLGRGGFGNVYLAEDPSLHRQVAIKVPRWDRPLTPAGSKRFLQEGKMLAQANHPSIVSVHDVGLTDDEIPFVVMEFVEGSSLADVLENNRLTRDESFEVLLKIAAGLQQAHKKGLIHRDFKPANAILGEDQNIHLVDFGLALHEELAPEDWESTAIVGTPSYMAPEQIRGENHLIDGQTDIWAFGVTMYLMLVNTLPFRGSNGRRELSRAICYKNPKPLRQLDETIPKQLERICLRCLQKLMDDRYQSMADVIDELEAFQQSQEKLESSRKHDISESPSMTSLRALPKNQSDGETTATPSAGQSNSKGSVSGLSNSGTDPTGLSRSDSISSGESARPALVMVPKGLRSFDQNDHEFFLELLPGPTDRHGVPESLRFWLARLDVANQVDDVPFGIIYGPSGSGKSSFIRAGLIPSLSDGVLPVYIDCTTTNLPERISRQIQREVHRVPANQPLAKTLREFRVGGYLRQGDKLLLVFDQFEQWLSSCDNFEEHELTLALRQCDSDRIQALFLIRDEFWLSASQFMRCLGQRIEEKKNAMSLPLFDERHARRVLEATGRAYGALPTSPQSLSKQQRRFVKEAVSSLATRGKVICVHLMVFAETVKNSVWDYSILKSAGGIDGVGREYITGIFGDPDTPNYIKKHSDDAWRILKHLLPNSTLELKGVAKRRSDLIADAELQHNEPCFKELMEFLEHDANLISKVEDSRAVETEDSQGNSGNHEDRDDLYGLTHDFLVKPIQHWGEGIESSTLKGQSETRLALLGGQWQSSNDARFLPSIVDYAKFKTFAGAQHKSKYADYLKAATKKVAVLVTIAGLIFCTLGVGYWQFNQSRRKSERLLLLSDYVSCESRNLDRYWPRLRPQLSKVADELVAKSTDSNPRVRFRANCALLAADPEDLSILDAIVSDISKLTGNECHTLCEIVAPNKMQLNSEIEKRIETVDDVITKCRLAIVLAHLRHIEPLAKLMEAGADPTPRTYSILQLPDWHDHLPDLVSSVADIPSHSTGDLRSGICCGLGLMDVDAVEPKQRLATVTWLKELYQNDPHGGTHFAAWYALDKWNVEHPSVDHTKIRGCQWKIETVKTESGKEFEIPMVRIPRGSFIYGDGSEGYPPPMVEYPAGEKATVGQDFWLGVFEIEHELFDEVARELANEDTEIAALLESNEYQDSFKSNKKGYPANAVSWIDASRFVNWVNREMNSVEAYAVEEQKLVSQNSNARIQLPSYQQFELSQRAGSRTRFFFGDDPSLLPSLCGNLARSEPGRGGSFPPNAFGCFDLSSNEREFTSELVVNNVMVLTKGANVENGQDSFESAAASPIPIEARGSFKVAIRLCEPIK